jgi:hypothetical protein
VAAARANLRGNARAGECPECTGTKAEIASIARKSAVGASSDKVLPRRPWPPIYGIFLGNPSADYSKLQQLADTTGGAFYLIPPNRPDSLVTVVKSILNLILKNFDPVSATLQNASLVPSQTSSSSAFVRQSDNVSWRLQLDSAIGLREGLNRMTLTSTFRDSSSGESDIRNTEFWLKVDQSSVSGDGLKPDSSFGWTCFEASSLRILTAS